MSDPTNFDKFLSDFKSSLNREFEERNACEEQLTQRGFTKQILQKIMAHKPLSVAVPSEYGGRGMHVKECLSILEAASYESLPLSLIFGINIALFLEPYAKYGDDDLKPMVFDRFINHQAMGGLMISEPLHGSDALNMQSYFLKKGDEYEIKGTKHWQGLTGMADFWLIACREKNDAGNLGKDIGLFLADDAREEQKIVVEEYYLNNGLYPIPYGKNILDIKVPANFKLTPESSGIKMLMDVLHRSRMQFPGMAMGFLKRILEVATKHCSKRMIRGNSLMQFDQVNYHLVQLQSAFTICSAMCHRSIKISGYQNNLATSGVEANIIKAYVTELMQNASQILIQLQGANGYKIMSLGSRAIMDSRPFQIFEGPNEMLFSQISESVVKDMKRKSFDNLYEYFKVNDLSLFSAERYKSLLNFKIDHSIPQRKHVILGEIISRVVSANYVIELDNSGFNKALVNASLDYLGQEISSLLNSYGVQESIMPVDDFESSSSWNLL